MNIQAKNLTKEAPASARSRVGGYAILARMADKGRASIAGTVGEYHFDCPLDNFLFDFMEVKGSEVKPVLESGASNEDVAKWLESHGAKKTPDEIKAWSDSVEAAKPYENPEKKEWFAEQCATVGLDPAKSTLFDFLDADDKKSFKS